MGVWQEYGHSGIAGVSGCSQRGVAEDGRDKIVTHEYIDKKTGKVYTVTYVHSNDIKSIPIKVANGTHWYQDAHDWHWEYEWRDVEQKVTHVMSNGVEVSKTVGPETLGQVRLTTLYNNKWYAKIRIARYEGGIMFTSKSGSNEETKKAVLPVDVINIDKLLATFDVAYKAETTKNVHEQLKKITNAKTIKEKTEAIKDLAKIVENTIKVAKRVAEAMPIGSTESSNSEKRYTPNSTICLSCENAPHGLTDVIIDSEGNVRDTIKHATTIIFNPKTQRSETVTKHDTIPTKEN